MSLPALAGDPAIKALNPDLKLPSTATPLA